MKSTRRSPSFSLMCALSAAALVGARAQDASPSSSTPSTPVSSPGDGYFSDWFARVTRIQAEQPHWVTPMTTVTPRLEEEFRYDQSWETTSSGAKVVNFGGGKGLELIPAENIEVILGVPAWMSRDKPANTDGFADDSFLLKYRLLSANEEQGNYIVTAFLGLQVPTGSKNNSTDHYMVTPTIAGGKGWGDFDVQSTLGVGIPDDGSARGGAGTPLQLNTAFQYRFLKVLWPEIEVNYTYWPNGEHSDKSQVFLTPGFIIGRLPIWQRLGMTVGLGYQVAVTSNPTFNHNFIASVRFPF